MNRTLVYMVVLVTAVWALFLAASAVISTLVIPVVNNETPTGAASVLRVFLGAVVFAAWVYGWHRLAVLWFYKVLVKRVGR